MGNHQNLVKLANEQERERGEILKCNACRYIYKRVKVRGTCQILREKDMTHKIKSTNSKNDYDWTSNAVCF